MRLALTKHTMSVISSWDRDRKVNNYLDPNPFLDILWSSPSLMSSRPGLMSSQSPTLLCRRSIRWNLSLKKKIWINRKFAKLRRKIRQNVNLRVWLPVPQDYIYISCQSVGSLAACIKENKWTHIIYHIIRKWTSMICFLAMQRRVQKKGKRILFYYNVHYE